MGILTDNMPIAGNSNPYEPPNTEIIIDTPASSNIVNSPDGQNPLELKNYSLVDGSALCKTLIPAKLKNTSRASNNCFYTYENMPSNNLNLDNSANSKDIEYEIPLYISKSPLHQEQTHAKNRYSESGTQDVLPRTTEENSIDISNNDAGDDNSRGRHTVSISSSEIVYIETPGSSNANEGTSEIEIISSSDIKPEITSSTDFFEVDEEEGINSEKVTIIDNVSYTSPESPDKTFKAENTEEMTETESIKHIKIEGNVEGNISNETPQSNNIVLGTFGSTFYVADIYSGVSSMNEIPGNNGDMDSENQDSSNQAERRFQCNSCDKRFHSRANLLRHEVVHTGKKGYPCSICGKEFSREYNLTTHRRIHTEEKNFNCDICGKGFYWKSCLTRHMGVHTDKDDFTCHICGKVFFNKSYVMGHMVVHTKEKVFKCDICGKGFSFKVSLRKHKVMHTNEKEFKCDICGKEFFQKSNLNLHRVVHTVVKEFKCDICEKLFTSKTYLSDHITLHTGEFACEICGKTFTCGKFLLQHKVKHSNPSVTGKPSSNIKGTCELCGKTFSRKSHLTLHMVVHSGERNFKCDECGKAFFHKFNLVQHKAIHTGSIKCSICGKIFSRKSRLRDHLKIHIPKKNPHAGEIFAATNSSSDARSDLPESGYFHNELADPAEEITIEHIKIEATEVEIHDDDDQIESNEHTDDSLYNCNVQLQNENEDSLNQIDSRDNISTSSEYNRGSPIESVILPTSSSFGTIPYSTPVSQDDGVNVQNENQDDISQLSVLRYFMELRASAKAKPDQISANQVVTNSVNRQNIEAYVGNYNVYSSGPNLTAGSIRTTLQERIFSDHGSSRTKNSYAGSEFFVLGSQTAQLSKAENADSISAIKHYTLKPQNSMPNLNNRCATEIEEIYFPTTIKVEREEDNDSINAEYDTS